MILRKSGKPPRESSEARTAIVDAAVRIVEDGERQFDARSVAKEAGRSLGTLTHHFKGGGLWELRGAVAARGFLWLAGALRQASADSGTVDPEQQLRQMALGYLRFAAEHSRLYRAMFADEWGELVLDAQQALHGILRRQIELCQEAGVLRQGAVERIERSGIALLHGIAVLVLDGRVSSGEVDAVGRDAIEDLFEGLKRRG
jgi:AcrR family transcriptional regulator